MSNARASRAGFLAWSLLVCPTLGWLVAVFGTRGEGALPTFVFLFIVLPACLSLTGAAATRTGVRLAAPAAIAAGALGGATWLLTILWLVATGFFDT